METNRDFGDFMEKIAKEADGKMPFGDFDFGKELGLNDEQLQGLKAKLPQITSEFLQGGLQFAEEEKQIIANSERFTKQLGDLLAQNINASRNFFLTLATLSLTVIGAVISARASSHDLFKGTVTLYSGIGLLAVCIVASVLYLLDRLTSENRNLTTLFAFQQSSMAEWRDLMRRYFAEKKSFDDYFSARKTLLEKNKQEETSLRERTRKQSKLVAYAPVIIGYSFLGGLGLIALALMF